jgi:von Willebrand factor type A domain
VELSFLTPVAGVFAVTAVVPLAIFVGRERRGERIRRALALGPAQRRARLPVAVSLAALPALLGLAATQPVVVSSQSVAQRTDAQVFVVLDTSRSMLASASADAPTRFDRARAAAVELQRGLPEVPVGLASLTSRVLPHLFPTTDARVFEATLTESMAVNRPPAALFSELATSIGALSAVPRGSFFAPLAEKRVLVVLTDGETNEVGPELATPFQRRPRIETIFVRFWSADERIYETGAPESGYLPSAIYGPRLARASELVGGRVLSEDELGSVLDAARSHLGSGPTAERSSEGERLALMPYVTLAAFLPLAYVLWRRNV